MPKIIKMEMSDKFQGLCLESMQGKDLIGNYDIMPPQIRELVCNSNFNICPACLCDMAIEFANKRLEHYPTPEDYKRALEQMESMIRNMEV